MHYDKVLHRFFLLARRKKSTAHARETTSLLFTMEDERLWKMDDFSQVSFILHLCTEDEAFYSIFLFSYYIIVFQQDQRHVTSSFL